MAHLASARQRARETWRLEGQAGPLLLSWHGLRACWRRGIELESEEESDSPCLGYGGGTEGEETHVVRTENPESKGKRGMELRVYPKATEPRNTPAWEGRG